MRFEATCRVPLPMYRWIVLVSACQVEASSSRFTMQMFCHTTEQEPLPPASMIFVKKKNLLFFLLSCEFDFLVNTFAWFRNRGDSFSFYIGKPFPTEKGLFVVSWPPTVWPNMTWWCSHRCLYCLDCKLCTGREQFFFAVLRLNVK